MEPMTLGSPVGSPHSPGVTSPYLPSFLMGERDPSSSLPMNKSPSRLVRHLTFSSPSLCHQNPQSASTPVFNSPPSGPPGSVPRQERVAGPPTRGLFDEPPGVQFDSSLYTHPNTSVFSPNCSTDLDSGSNSWVTVFGFPPSSASVILAQFGSYGHIVDTRSSRGGNWVHVRYQSRSEARRALANNGKVFGDTIMIGVVQCRDQNITSNDGGQKENVSFPSQSDTPRPVHNPFLSSSLISSPGFDPDTSGQANLSMTRNNARPLGQAYRNAQHDTEVVMARNIPQKSTSVVTKAWEFLGW